MVGCNMRCGGSPSEVMVTANSPYRRTFRGTDPTNCFYRGLSTQTKESFQKGRGSPEKGKRGWVHHINSESFHLATEIEIGWVRNTCSVNLSGPEFALSPSHPLSRSICAYNELTPAVAACSWSVPRVGLFRCVNRVSLQQRHPAPVQSAQRDVLIV